jgi:hypothetical protein
MRDAQARMRDDDGPRDVMIRRDWRDDRDRGGWREDRRDWRESRDDSDRPMRFGFPNFNLFGPDN